MNTSITLIDEATGKSFKRHELKIQSIHFNDLLRGRKAAEVRLNDRDYQVGDVLYLYEIDENDVSTGQGMSAQVSHILHGGQFGIDKGWCVLSLSKTTHLEALNIISFLRDRLQECCDCIEAGYSATRKAGCVTTDAEMTVKDSRYFVEEASVFLKGYEEAAK